MLAMFKKKWFWITVTILIINIAGISKIISVLENRQGYKSNRTISTSIGKKIRQLIWPVKKAAKDTAKKLKQDGFKVESIKPSMSDLTPSIDIRLSHDIDLDKIKGYIEVSPEVNFYAQEYYYGITLYGKFLPGESYTVRILKGMPSAKGSLLKETVKKKVVIPDYEATFNFKVPGIYMSLQGNRILPIEATNVDKLKVKVHKVYANNIVYLLNNITSYRFPDDLGIDVSEKEIATKCERNKPREVLLDLKDVLPQNSQGLFFITINKPDGYYWSRDSKLVLTTDIGITAKKSNSGLLVWVNSLSTTSAIKGATVKVFTKTNQQMIEGTTDENGLVHFEDIDYSNDRIPFVITASKGDDLSFIELEKCALSDTDFDIQGRPYLNAGYEAFLYTDRGIYRPGEEVHLRAIVRGINYETPKSFPVVFEIKRPDGRKFKKINGMLSEFGTVDIDISIPDYALTGGYRANLLIPGSKKIIGSAKFNVEEFMPDRLKVNVSVADKRFSITETIPIKVTAEQFFGAAASKRLVEVTCNLRSVEFKSKEYKDYVFTDNTKDFSKRTFQLGEKESNSEGEAEFELKIPDGIMPPSALHCAISASVKELGGRAVTSLTERYIDTYPYYLGLRKSIEGYAAVNKEISFDYVAVSAEGKKVTVPELEINIAKIIWNNVLKKDKSGKYRYISESREESVFKDTMKSGSSSGTFTFTPKTWGSYIVRIKGKEKGAHTASLKFYCTGYGGYMPWAMERPDRIELTLDKPRYNAGDEAKLVIKSPFKGKALITISKGKVLDVKTIELSSSTQEIPITIDQNFSPNAYCSVTVIRPVVKDEKWAAHRAYGIIPIMLNNSEHKLKLKIDAPASASPKDTVKVNIAIENSVSPAELSIALVDEGILRLTGFRTPDIYNFFYGKRANNIAAYDLYSLLIPEFGKKKAGSDSTPAGDRANAFDPKKHLNPISVERVKPVVLWMSNIVTDSQGKAHAEFKIPQFSGNLKIMVVAASNDNFGNGEGDMKVVEPLMIKPTLPRFLSVDDEFILPVSVFNTTGRNGKAAVSVTASEGFKMLGERSIAIDIKNNKEGMVSFKLKAPALPQKGEIKVAASMGEYSTSRSIELPVRPPAPFTTISGSGAVKAPGDKLINIPGTWLKGTEKYSLIVMSLPGLQFAGGLKYLMQYPYGCIEQTVSCVFPFLYLKDIAAVIEPDKFNLNLADYHINEAIQKVLSMQLYSGGFAYWPGYQNISKWGSVYAAEFLVEADKAGYAVPKFEKNVALDYCEKILSGKEEDYSLELKTYSCFVLAKANRVKASWIRRLQEVKDKLPGYSKFRLAAALAILGDKKAVSEILGQSFPDTKVKRETGGSLNSYTRENAIALSVYMDIDPENEMVPVLIKRLEASMKDGKWQTTQDNALALVALGKYARFVKTQEIDYKGSISIGRELITEFNHEKGVRIENIALGNKDINLSVDGEGRAYYYWSAEGVPAKGEVEEKDQGIKVRRSFFTRDGKPLDINNIKQGQIIVVDIALSTNTFYKNVIVEDLLPACFEIENPRIATRATVSWINKDIFEPDHIDIRDDRFLIFTDIPYYTGSSIHYRYIVRAVTKGEFALPAISASCMYDPSIVSVNGAGRIKVKEYEKE